MGPVRQNPIQRTVSLFICVCITLCRIVAHNIAQNRPDSFPPYPPDNHHGSDDVYLREGGTRFGWPLQVTVRPMPLHRWPVCLSCLSICIVGVLRPNGWMDQDATWYGDIVLHGELALPRKGARQPPHFLAHVYCDQVVAHLSNCWALVKVYSWVNFMHGVCVCANFLVTYVSLHLY